MNKVQNRSPPLIHHIGVNKTSLLDVAHACLASVSQHNGVSLQHVLVP